MSRMTDKVSDESKQTAVCFIFFPSQLTNYLDIQANVDKPCGDA